MNILFTCACGKKSEQLFKIIRKNFKEKINLYGCDIKKKTKKTYLNNFFQIDFENKKKFIKQIFDVCKEYKIDFLFASADREIDIFAKNIKKFNRIKTKILVNNQNYSKIFNDKFKTYEALKKIKVDVPKYKLVKKISNVDKILKDFDYPKKSVIVKSRHGIGGRGVYLLLGKQKTDRIEYKWFGNFNREKKIYFLNSKIKDKIFKPNNSIIMEALSSPSYDVDVLNFKKRYMTSIRKRINPAGIPYKGSKVVNEKNIEKIIKKVLKTYDLKFILDFDFMTHSITKKPLICEINARPSGSIVDSEIQGNKIFTNFLKILLKD
jgi:carbamoylphosphate synthase large subunit